MRLHTRRLFVFLFLALAGCASRSDLDYVRADMEELKTRLFKAEKNMGELRNETKEGVEKNLQGLQKGAADTQAAIEAIRVDMQVTAGKLDDLALSLKKPADDLALLKDDTNRRFTSLEGRLEKLEKHSEEQQKAAEAAPENPDALYQKGLDTFKGGDFLKARELLTRFIEKYPAHGMIANARYWLGETYYSEKKYDQAILEFQDVIKKFPGKEKVPAAMLKQGMAFKELGDVKSARYLYNHLLKEFPASDEAKLAKEKLKALH